ncbi:MAG: hypothetical protein ACOYJL_04300 [Tractidigestivibacter sp.]|jgi:hypothetical protein|uniref:hypothetical protein n=1 Tax=Tractidigestivibacter sp. TaxID=2847320 RepID=UPI003D8D5D7F
MQQTTAFTSPKTTLEQRVSVIQRDGKGAGERALIRSMMAMPLSEYCTIPKWMPGGRRPILYRYADSMVGTDSPVGEVCRSIRREVWGESRLNVSQNELLYLIKLVSEPIYRWQSMQVELFARKKKGGTVLGETWRSQPLDQRIELLSIYRGSAPIPPMCVSRLSAMGFVRDLAVLGGSESDDRAGGNDWDRVESLVALMSRHWDKFSVGMMISDDWHRRSDYDRCDLREYLRGPEWEFLDVLSREHLTSAYFLLVNPIARAWDYRHAER